MARLPDGRFHVRSGGQDVALPPAQAAQAVGLPLADFESRMAQATQAALAAPRPAAGTLGAAPPIWQGRARHGDYAEVISRNPDGTFQVRVAGKELTRTERDVAYMTGLTKAPLYAMLAKATEGRMGANAASAGRASAGQFNARQGDRGNLVVPGGLESDPRQGFDRAAHFEKPVADLFGALQTAVDLLSGATGRQSRRPLDAGPNTRNQSAPAVTFEADGTIGIAGDARLWAEGLLNDNRGDARAARDQAQATIHEELWHAAQLAGMRNDWIRAGSPGSFVDWVHARSTEIMESIGDAAARATPAEAARIKQALFDTWSLYFAPEGHGQTPESVFRQLTSPVQRGRLVARGTFLAEFTRQLHQAGVTGQTTETAGLLGRLKAWVQQALDGLKQAYAMARGGALGQPLRDLMDRTEAVLQGRESALPIQPGLHLPSGPGDAFGARWAPKPIPDGVTAAEVESWRRFLEDKRVENPVYTVEACTWDDYHVPLDKTLKDNPTIKQAFQDMLNLIPREVIESACSASGGFIKFATVQTLSSKKLASYDPNTKTLLFSSNEYEMWKSLDNARRVGVEAQLPQLLRESVWHEITHWLYLHADAHPRLKMWRDNLEQHWNERTTGLDVQEDPDGSFYLDPGWIDRYAGIWYPSFGWGFELPTIYLEQMSYGPERVAWFCINPKQIATFKIAASLFGPL